MNTLGHCAWKKRSLLEEEEEEDGSMRRGFHFNLFILSIYRCFPSFHGCDSFFNHVLVSFLRA